jgi:hypothetical protein
MANSTMTIDVGMVDWSRKSTLWGERGVIFLHINVQDEGAGQVSALGGPCTITFEKDMFDSDR